MSPTALCWLFRRHAEFQRLQALKEGTVTALAAVKRDAEEGEGPGVHTVYETASAVDLDGAVVVGTVALEDGHRATV